MAGFIHNTICPQKFACGSTGLSWYHASVKQIYSQTQRVMENKCRCSVLLQVLVVAFSCCQSITTAVMITQGPQNLTVYVGETVNFPCTYTGTITFPVWYINDYSYTITANWQRLPPRHTYSIAQQKIIVTDVQLSDNGTTYCCVLYGDQALYSDKATLTLVTAPQDDIASVTEMADATTQMVLSTEEITRGSTDLLTTDANTSPVITKGGPDPASSDSASLATELTDKDEKIMHQVFAGITSCVGIILVACISIIILILCLIHQNRQTRKSHLQEHVYEDIPDVLTSTAEMKMDPNVCYSRGKLTEPDYAEINNIVMPKSCGKCTQQSDKDYNVMVSKVALVRLNTSTE